MNVNSVKGDTIEARLRCLGAKDIQQVQGIMYFVSFDSSGTEVSYCYNINAKNKYFLQRIKPYPIPEGIFSDQEQVVEFIKRDLAKFNNAHLSHNFTQFIDTTNMIQITSKEIEEFFLNYNVDKECLDNLSKVLRDVRTTISEAKERSEHILI
ncbi:MAG: hypothetical protein RR090_05515 [Niameybacter sp.]|uniref:hypothetical protein n=1 Tax=Niameybacter sp. TaxID=2033640 RepID=UPI002FC6E49C